MKNLNQVEILLVEDNPVDAELTIRALKEQKLANEMFVVENGVEALDFLYCRGKFDQRTDNSALKVVFLDVKLPKLNGLEVLQKMKSDPEIKKIPVVMVTSSCEDPDIRKAYELGANSYVVKPVGFEHFIKAVQNTGLYWLLVNQPSK
jgi:two-component system, response regulator